MFNRPTAAFVVLATVALVVGCSSEEDGDPGMKVEKTCLDTEQQKSAKFCNRYGACSCSHQGFKATLPTTKSDAVAAACNKMLDRVSSCGGTTTVTSNDCEIWAKTEVPEVVTNYECIAALPCEDDGTSCERATTDFGQWLCDAMADLCGTEYCGDELRAGLDRTGGWLKESVRHAALRCAMQSTCSAGKECLAAWEIAARL